jgi:hypothetical protein
MDEELICKETISERTECVRLGNILIILFYFCISVNKLLCFFVAVRVKHFVFFHRRLSVVKTSWCGVFSNSEEWCICLAVWSNFLLMFSIKLILPLKFPFPLGIATAWRLWRYFRAITHANCHINSPQCTHTYTQCFIAGLQWVAYTL